MGVNLEALVVTAALAITKIGIQTEAVLVGMAVAEITQIMILGIVVVSMTQIVIQTEAVLVGTAVVVITQIVIHTEAVLVPVREREEVEVEDHPYLLICLTRTAVADESFFKQR